MFLYLRDNLGIMETTSLLEKEVITPNLGRSIDMLLIYGHPFSVQRMVQFGHFHSNSESDSRFLTNKNFLVWKMVQIE
jgi:hypothetical protein